MDVIGEVIMKGVGNVVWGGVGEVLDSGGQGGVSRRGVGDGKALTMIGRERECVRLM